MDAGFEPIARNTVAEEIIKQVILQINTGKLRPGSKLPSERELMELFQVSRSSVREALHSMTMIGLLETYPGAGTFVSKQLTDMIAARLEWSLLLGNHELLELMEVREPLEIQAAGLAAERATPEEIDGLREVIQRYAISLKTGENLMEMELLVHRTIAQMAGNPTLLRFINTFQEFLFDYRASRKIGFSTDEISVAEYMEIAQAIEQGDEEKARACMARHIQKSKRNALVEQLREQPEQQKVSVES